MTAFDFLWEIARSLEASYPCISQSAGLTASSNSPKLWAMATAAMKYTNPKLGEIYRDMSQSYTRIHRNDPRIESCRIPHIICGFKIASSSGSNSLQSSRKDRTIRWRYTGTLLTLNYLSVASHGTKPKAFDT